MMQHVCKLGCCICPNDTQEGETVHFNYDCESCVWVHIMSCLCDSLARGCSHTKHCWRDAHASHSPMQGRAVASFVWQQGLLHHPLQLIHTSTCNTFADAVTSDTKQ